MNKEKFEKIVLNRIDYCIRKLSEKNKGYSPNGDAFEFFKIMGEVAGETTEKAMFGGLVKHFASVRMICQNPKTITREMIREKIGDAINYLFILEGILMERIYRREAAISKVHGLDDNRIALLEEYGIDPEPFYTEE